MLTGLLKPNFAPVEQYGEDTSLRQGPLTDLYALGATLRFALTGRTPTPSVIRAVRDELTPLASASLVPQAGAPEAVSPLFLAAIDWALTVALEGRPQDLASLFQVMRGETAPPTYSAAKMKADAIAVTAACRRRHRRRARRAGVGGRRGVGRLARWRGRVAICTECAGSAARADTDHHAAVPALATEPAPAPASETPRPPAAAPLPATPATVNVHLPTRKRRSQAAPTTGTAMAAPAGMIPPVRAAAAVAAAPATAAVAGAVAKAGLRDLESCTKLGFFAGQLCVARQCARPEAQADPRCAERRRGNDERLRRTQ